MANSSTADRNLLFGVLALQMDFISADDLIAAMRAWVFDKARPLGDLLVEGDRLSAERRRVLDLLLEEHVRAHAGNAAQSLAALPARSAARAALAPLGDLDVQASLLPSAGCDAAAAPTLPHQSAAGRYTIIRPHARGGLGEVFVAEDAELRREVALKEIRAERARDAGDRVRFLSEAEITAGLEHPGVVPVYGLGIYPDGRPFYAMRLIRGESLKEAIKRFHDAGGPLDDGARSLEFRRLLARFVAVCQAIAYAHSRGVVHRDIKPDNVMLGKFGETLVVDWGLAKAVGRPETAEDCEPTLRPSSGSDLHATRAGVALGTPAFMSPEQAAGRIEAVGTRSDVYGLGATLQALLTGKPPVIGDDVGEILRKVQTGERVGVCAANPQAPAALAAVCDKAMALRPNDRYATSLELAAEVEHWLADEPVAAYPDPLAVRARRLMRRHRTSVTAAVAALAAATVLLSVGLAQVNAARSTAQRERDRAEQAFGMARDAVEKYLGAATQNPKLTEADLAPLRKELLESAVPFYEWFTTQRPGDVATEEERGAAYRRLGLVYAEIGERPRACDALARCVEILEAAGSDGRDEILKIADAREGLARILSQLDRNSESEFTVQHAIVLLNKLSTSDQERPETQLELARCLQTLFRTQKQLGKREAAESSIRDCVAAFRAVGRQSMLSFNDELRLADAINSLGVLLCDHGQFPAALAAYTDCRTMTLGLAEKHPKSPHCRAELARVEMNLGIEYLWHLNQPNEARTALEESAATWTKLNDEFPSIPENRSELAKVRYCLAVLFRRAGRMKEAETEARAALAIRKKLVADFPTTPQYRFVLAQSHINLGNWLMERESRSDAEREFRSAIDALEDLISAIPDLPEYRHNRMQAGMQLGQLLLEQPSRFAEGRTVFNEALHAADALVAAHPQVADYRGDAIGANVMMGGILHAYGLGAEADRYYRRALDLDPNAAVAVCNYGLLLLETGDPKAALALLRRGDELGGKLPTWSNPSKEWVREAERLVEAEPMLADVLAGKRVPADAAERMRFADLCLNAQRRRYTAAANLFKAANALAPDLAMRGERPGYDRVAIAAVAAAAGLGADAADLTPDARSALRRDALAWLRADRARLDKVISSLPPASRRQVRERMTGWMLVPELSSVRDPEALKKLPPSEREPWKAFWEELRAAIGP